jgi:tetratricopeptide (TPR) repeat protein
MGSIARSRLLLWAVCGALAGAVWPLAGFAFANVEVGQLIENEELPTLDGGRELFLSKKALANVFIFFRPNHDHSLETLKAMALCEKEFSGKAVRWVAVVSDSWSRAEVQATVAEAGIRMSVLVDQGDQLYGRLGVRLHPVVGVADDKLRLLDYVPFHKINYCDMIRVRVRRALHEVDQAAVDKVDHPDKALMPSDIPGAVAKRHVKLGEMLLKSKQYGKAADQARIAIEKLPLYAPAHVLLGRALAAQGSCGEALPAFEAAQKIDPRSAAAADGQRACAGKK